MEKRTKVIIIISSIVAALALAVATPFIVHGVKSAGLKSDYSYLRTDATYSKKAEVKGLELVTQHFSCGYASIEMVSSFYGNKVTEDELDARNGAVSTSSSNGFLKEINKSIPSKTFVMNSYLKNDALLKEVHDSLTKNDPVVVEWAAKYEAEWTLHFSVVTGLDLASDVVTVYNPYGYIENIKVNEFLDRTSFDAYQGMPLFLGFGFAFGAFDKNVVFHVG